MYYMEWTIRGMNRKRENTRLPMQEALYNGHMDVREKRVGRAASLASSLTWPLVRTLTPVALVPYNQCVRMLMRFDASPWHTTKILPEGPIPCAPQAGVPTIYPRLVTVQMKTEVRS